MSQYIKFMLDHAGAPTPKTVAVLKHEQRWVDAQIVDEFKNVFPGVRVTLYDIIEKNCGDLVVLPFIGDFLINLPGGVPLFRTLQQERNTWVMLYRLDFRRIEVLPARNLNNYYRRRWILRGVSNRIHRYGLQLPFKIIVHFWKRGVSCAF
jgi:hypothetical protein